MQFGGVCASSQLGVQLHRKFQLRPTSTLWTLFYKLALKQQTNRKSRQINLIISLIIDFMILLFKFPLGFSVWSFLGAELSYDPTALSSFYVSLEPERLMSAENISSCLNKQPAGKCETFSNRESKFWRLRTEEAESFRDSSPEIIQLQFGWDPAAGRHETV